MQPALMLNWPDHAHSGVGSWPMSQRPRPISRSLGSESAALRPGPRARRECAVLPYQNGRRRSLSAAWKCGPAAEQCQARQPLQAGADKMQN